MLAERGPWQHRTHRAIAAALHRLDGSSLFLEAFASEDPASLPQLLRDELDCWKRVKRGIDVFSPEARRRRVRAWLGGWICLRLRDRGFRVASEPGTPPVLARGDQRIEPHQWVEDLAAGRRSDADWTALWAETA